jgi:hypothetical protein
MKKRVHSHNRRRKKTVAQRKAAYARCITAPAGEKQFLRERDERQFLVDVLLPFRDAIVKAMAPHFHDAFEGDDPADDPDLVHYAVDLIHDAGGIMTAIHDIYRDGAEAGLRHVERAIEWYSAFDARHQVGRRPARCISPRQRPNCGPALPPLFTRNHVVGVPAVVLAALAAAVAAASAVTDQ